MQVGCLAWRWVLNRLRSFLFDLPVLVLCLVPHSTIIYAVTLFLELSSKFVKDGCRETLIQRSENFLPVRGHF